MKLLTEIKSDICNYFIKLKASFLIYFISGILELIKFVMQKWKKKWMRKK